MGLPPGPLPGMVCGPPLTSVWLHAQSSQSSTVPLASVLGVVRLPPSLTGRPSGEFDLAAARGSGARAHGPTDFRNDDARGGLAAQLAGLVDGLLERCLHSFWKFLQRLFE